MAMKIADRTRETSTTTGLGNFTLSGSPSSYQTFNTALSNGDTTWYCIANLAANEWEVGVGTFTAPTTLARTLILASSNAGAAVNFSAGTKDVFITAPAVSLLSSIGSVTTGNSPYTALSTDDLIEITDGGLAVVLYGNPFIGQKVTVVWSAAPITATAPTVTSSNGIGIESLSSQGTFLAAATTTALNTLYQRATWEYDGTNWVLLRALYGFKSQTFTASGTFNVPPGVTAASLDGCGGGGGGGAGAPGIIGLGAQNGGGGGGGAFGCHAVGNVPANGTVAVTIGAGGAGGVGANGANGGDTTFGTAATFPGAAGGEFGGTPAAGTAAGGGSNINTSGIARIGTGNPTWTGPNYGGWGGATGGPTAAGKGAAGQTNAISYSGPLGTGGTGGNQGATNTNPGGCGGGGGGAGPGAVNTVSTHNGGNGRNGGAGSALGTGGNGIAGLGGTGGGAGGGGGGAGGNGAVAGGNGANGGAGHDGSLTVTWVTTVP